MGQKKLVRRPFWGVELHAIITILEREKRKKVKVSSFQIYYTPKSRHTTFLHINILKRLVPILSHSTMPYISYKCRQSISRQSLDMLQILMSVLKRHTTVGKMLSATTQSVAMCVFVKTATLLWTTETLTAQVSNNYYRERETWAGDASVRAQNSYMAKSWGFYETVDTHTLVVIIESVMSKEGMLHRFEFQES